MGYISWLVACFQLLTDIFGGSVVGLRVPVRIHVGHIPWRLRQPAVVQNVFSSEAYRTFEIKWASKRTIDSWLKRKQKWHEACLYTEAH